MNLPRLQWGGVAHACDWPGLLIPTITICWQAIKCESPDQNRAATRGEWRRMETSQQAPAAAPALAARLAPIPSLCWLSARPGQSRAAREGNQKPDNCQRSQPYAQAR